MSRTRRKRGRPGSRRAQARSERVVTFVTRTELEALDRIARDEDRSLSFVVHRILARHLKGQT